MKKIAIVLGLCALAMSGCGNPSKEDICGDCSGIVKDACEASYDICDEAGEDECFDALEDAYGAMC